MTPQQLSHELRTEHSRDLDRRRWIVGLSILGSAMSHMVTLYQTGILKRLPDPGLPLIDSNKTDASEYAYKRLRSPDGTIMMATYAVTTWLGAAGGRERALGQPWLPLLMSGKLLFDIFSTLNLAREEWQTNKAFCIYCQVATAASLVSALIAIPEARRAIKTLRQ